MTESLNDIGLKPSLRRRAGRLLKYAQRVGVCPTKLHCGDDLQMEFIVGPFVFILSVGRKGNMRLQRYGERNVADDGMDVPFTRDCVRALMHELERASHGFSGD